MVERTSPAAATVSRRGRVTGWLVRAIPTRERLAGNRWLRPVAHRVLAPSLWRFTRRSVPRGVALGLGTGLLFPFAHMPIAAVAALPIRANVPVAVGVTLLSNPLTLPPLLYCAFRIGHWVLRIDAALPGAPVAHATAANVGWLHWLVSEAGPSTIVGMLVITAVLATLGYALTALGWRVWIARKWRHRHDIKPH